MFLYLLKMDSEKKQLQSPAAVAMSPDTEVGTVVDIGDEGTRQFYGNSVSDSYRMKSEIVNKCMEEIGMGRSVMPWSSHNDRCIDSSVQISVAAVCREWLWLYHGQFVSAIPFLPSNRFSLTCQQVGLKASARSSHQSNSSLQAYQASH